jgi:uncharacterized protein (TIGR00251 family)
VDGPSTRLRLRVSPGASRTEIVGRHDDGWKVRLTAAAESGKANAALVELLSGALGVAASRIAIVRGKGSRDKIVLVRGLSRTEVEARLGAPTGVA